MTRLPGEPPAVRFGTAAPRLLMVGLSCLDHVWRVERFPPHGSRTDATAYEVHGGGPAASAAVAAARLGARAELWALHGDDDAGDRARAELERFGVGVERLRTLPGARTFVSAVLVEPGGERWIFPYRGARLDDDPAAFPLRRVADYDALHADLRHPELCGAALRAAREAGVPTVVDYGNARHFELAVHADHLIVSEECAAEILGRDDPEAALAALRRRPDQTVGITLGPEGFLYDAPEVGVRHMSALPVEVVDSTGAGDVFHGAYALGVAAGWNAEQRALVASVAAALACTAPGREGVPDAATVERLLERRTAREMDEMRWT